VRTTSIATPAASPQAQDRAAVVTTDILQIVTRALLAWVHRERADLASVRAVVEARVRDEIEAEHPVRTKP
jgi:hypothetical protein